MSGAKHTPGPWATDEADHTEPYQDITIRAGRRSICRVWIDDAPVHDYNNEQRVNARLIAAAPELLEALKRLTTAIDHATELHRFSTLWDDARAAIAKATGDQP